MCTHATVCELIRATAAAAAAAAAVAAVNFWIPPAATPKVCWPCPPRDSPPKPPPKAAARKIRAAELEWIPVGLADLIRVDAVKRVAPVDIVDETTGEVLMECNEELTQEHLDEFKARGINEFPLLFLDPLTTGTAIRDTLLADKTLSQDEAMIEIYRRLRPGDPPTLETATNLFNNLFFNPERYDLSLVGRLKLNHKLSFDSEENVTVTDGLKPDEEPLTARLADLLTLRRDDILAAVKYLVDLKNGTDSTKRVDDIDHLGNRRVRVVPACVHNPCNLAVIGNLLFVGDSQRITIRTQRKPATLRYLSIVTTIDNYATAFRAHPYRQFHFAELLVEVQTRCEFFVAWLRMGMKVAPQRDNTVEICFDRRIDSIMPINRGRLT